MELLEPLRVEPLNLVQRKYLEDFINRFKLKHETLLENEINRHLSDEINRQELHYEDTKHLDVFFNDSVEDFNTNEHDLRSIISGRPLKKMTDSVRERINVQLAHFLERRNECTAGDEFGQYLDYKRKLEDLPIHSHRQQLLDLFSENQVVIISGGTGCGKSTQIPQYILEDMIQGKCKIATATTQLNFKVALFLTFRWLWCRLFNYCDPTSSITCNQCK